jgi:internalin A
MSWVSFRPAGVAVVLALLTCGGLRAGEAENQAVKAIEKLGGGVARDKMVKGRPVFAVVLAFTKVTDADLKCLKDIPGLKALHLISTKVTDAGLREVKDLKGLEELNLTSTAVTDAGLGELKDLKNLKTLYVQNTKVTAAGVAELQKALPKCKITR